MNMLGNVIEDDGRLRFFGSGTEIKSAYSTDGYNWTAEPDTVINGADPGVVKLPNGSYLAIYTSTSR